PLALQLRQMEEAHALRLREAEAVGADLAEVERLNGLERTKLLEEYGRQQAEQQMRQMQSIQAWLDNQVLGNLSSLSLADKIEEAQAQFGAAVDAAREGDAQAMSSLPQLADALLRLGREGYSSSVSYAGLEQFVRSQMEALLNHAAAPTPNSTAPTAAIQAPQQSPASSGTSGQPSVIVDNSGIVKAIWDSSAAVVEELSALRREIVNLKREQQLASQRQRIQGRA
uniref:hypothetical protein n=1 Tax=Telmatospirillum sp. J64-1 TaxID=2502183 RepID=UPI00163D536C